MTEPRTAPRYDEYLRKRPKQSQSRSVVEAILAAGAEALGGPGGEAALAVQEVAARAGVGIGSLYDYFSDRESLLAGVLAKVMGEKVERCEAAFRSTRDLPLEEAAGRIVDTVLELHWQGRALGRSLLRIAVAFGRMPLLMECHRRLIDSLADALRERKDISFTDVGHTAYVVHYAMLGQLDALHWDDRAFDRADVRRELVRLVTGYLRAENPSGAHGVVAA